MASDGFPRYLYKIVPTAPPEPLPQEYPLSELDQTDGFVHLSTDEQVGGVNETQHHMGLLTGRRYRTPVTFSLPRPPSSGC